LRCRRDAQPSQDLASARAMSRDLHEASEVPFEQAGSNVDCSNKKPPRRPLEQKHAMSVGHQLSKEESNGLESR
jgi:hypothetical protein